MYRLSGHPLIGKRHCLIDLGYMDINLNARDIFAISDSSYHIQDEFCSDVVDLSSSNGLVNGKDMHLKL